MRIREPPLRFALGLCATAGAADTGVVVLPAGALPRSGPGRLHVRLCRRLAAAGLPALRFDASGLGDRPPRHDGLPLRDIMEREPIQAMDALTQASGVRRHLLLGICAGAHAAFLAARLDTRVAGIVLVNPQDFVGDPAWVAMVQARGYAGNALHSLRSWGNLVTSRSDYRRIARTMMGRLAALLTGRDLEMDARAACIAATMHVLLERGCRVLCLLAGRDAAVDHVRALFGAVRHPDFTIQSIPDADHLFRLPAHQDEVLDRLCAWAEARAGEVAQTTRCERIEI